MVEPLLGVLGAVAVLLHVLSFAAGAMIFVVVEEQIPEVHQAGNADLVTSAVSLGVVHDGGARYSFRMTKSD